MDLGFLLSLIGLLGGLWIYLYTTITDLTVKAPADPTLLMMGFVHYAVLSYLVLTLYIFYCKGLGAPDNTRAEARLDAAIEILLQTWPLTLVAAAVAFLTSKSFSGDFAAKSVVYCLAIIGIGIPLLQSFRALRLRRARQLRTVYVVAFFANIIIVGWPYIFLMSYFLADVQITTDKEFYKPNESVIVSVRAAGYIARPYMKKVMIGIYVQSPEEDWAVIGDETLSVGPEQVPPGLTLIKVEYEPQVISTRRSAFHELKIAKDAKHGS